MRHHYATRGTCSRVISFDMDGGIVSNIAFEGGCHGNLQGVARLSEGRRAEEIVSILSGIQCGVGCGGKSQGGCNDLIARPKPCGQIGYMKRRRTVGHRHGVPSANLFRQCPLKVLNSRTASQIR